MNKPVVLLVDDEPRILKALLRLLRKAGFELLTAANGEEAVEILSQKPVALILSDYRMPGMNGEELLAIVKSRYPQIRRIMLSGFSSLDTAESAVGLAVAERLLTKPWDADELLSAIKSLLDGEE